MADYKDYNISDTANSALNEAALDKAFRDSSLSAVFDSINRDTGSSIFRVQFIGHRDAADITLADSIVAAHDGVALTNVSVVKLDYTTPGGVPEIAITKPDGNASTFISHNFCDNTTWPSTSDSKWSLAAPAGKKYKVLKAEVQFTHDVKMKTAASPKQMKLDVMAGGAPHPTESKVFNSIADVFDLGNKHYSMNVEVDGIPGMTTIVFDYANVIELMNAYGMSMDFYIADNTELEGTHCSVSLVAELYDE